MISAERLREAVHYDPETGVFTNRIYRPRAPAGKRAGCVDPSTGYRKITIDYEHHYEHRLAFLYMTGLWPTNQVDHRDTDRANNAWLNLRDVTRMVNHQNMRRAAAGSASGLLGAHRKRKRWSSQIKVHGRLIRLGYFDTAQSAHAAYIKAKRIHHEGCTL